MQGYGATPIHVRARLNEAIYVHMYKMILSTLIIQSGQWEKLWHTSFPISVTPLYDVTLTENLKCEKVPMGCQRWQRETFIHLCFHCLSLSAPEVTTSCNMLMLLQSLSANVVGHTLGDIKEDRNWSTFSAFFSMDSGEEKREEYRGFLWRCFLERASPISTSIILLTRRRSEGNRMKCYKLACLSVAGCCGFSA